MFTEQMERKRLYKLGEIILTDKLLALLNEMFNPRYIVCQSKRDSKHLSL